MKLPFSRAALAVLVASAFPLTGCFETISGPYDGPTVVEFEQVQGPGGYNLIANESSGTLTFKVNLISSEGQLGTDTVVSFDVDDSSSAVEGDDYTIVGGRQVTIPAGSTSATFQIAIVDDADVNDDVELVLNLNGTADGSIQSAPNFDELVITIENDDEPDPAPAP